MEIAKEAVKIHLPEAANLQSEAATPGESDVIIPDFHRALHKCAGEKKLLLAVDGLCDWEKNEVERTILPIFCAPFILPKEDSNVRVIVTLRENPGDEVWDVRPAGREPFEVAEFPELEWKRARRQFELYWCSQIRSDAGRAAFREAVDGYKNYPRIGATLESLRAAAEIQKNYG